MSLITRGLGAHQSSPRITLEVTPEMMAALEKLARDSEQPLTEVIRRSLALYRAALDAIAEGKHVGYATSPDSLDVEYTGIVGEGGR
ncbi:MAG TPA: ribbon-helix-helix domain-containing protein [Isosphaeraceae bacterium]|jgi:hypothetical protein|nr:ribbon-helix-helix domain-containing protein [Isosphaeraceae bacterium]